MPPTDALPWLEPSPPWNAPAASSLCAGLAVAPDDIPVVEVLSSPCALNEVVALRAGRFVPLFGTGARREEAVRALANVARALGRDADPRATDHALSMALHPVTRGQPLRALAQGALDGSAAPYLPALAMGYVLVLGAGDTLREQVARELVGPGTLALDLALSLGAGGGDFGTFREHYGALTTSSESTALPVRVARAWFDFVLARRFAGLDTLRSLAESPVDGPALDAASRWLIASADLVAGEEIARARMAELAEGALRPVAPILPRLMGLVAREMAEIVQHPLGLRFAHLQCAASRDHASVAIRAWLTAAIDPEPGDEASTEGRDSIFALGPEPTRAGRAAIEARARAGEFLLDWFVPDREPRETVDSFARRALRVYHRLRGAQILARVERELRPPAGTMTRTERIVWGAMVDR